MVGVPCNTPATKPLLFTVDNRLSLLLQTPPSVVLLNAVVLPTQTFAVPTIAATVGTETLVTTLLLKLIAPARVSALPRSDAPDNKLMAPLTSTVPLKTEFDPRSN